MPPWMFFVVPVVMIGLGLLIASSRRGSVDGTHVGSRRLELQTPGDPAAVFERLRAIGNPYNVDDADAQSKRLVLSSPPTFTTWGFLYPIVIRAHDGGSRVEIGITSRLIQIGPLVTRAHNNCLNAIEAVLGVPVARVAR